MVALLGTALIRIVLVLALAAGFAGFAATQLIGTVPLPHAATTSVSVLRRVAQALDEPGRRIGGTIEIRSVLDAAGGLGSGRPATTRTAPPPLIIVVGR